jgi:uncharacterized protein (DUF433 family)
MPPLTRRRNTTNDIRNQPAYTLAEAARYLRVPSATLRTWFLGRDYQTAAGSRRWHSMIVPVSKKPPLLSFWNLIEAHVLWGLRVDHRVSVKDVRAALSYAERELKIPRLLLRPELRTSAGSVFLERYGSLIDLSASGQIAMRQIFERHLRRVEWDRFQFPVRLFPFSSADAGVPEQAIAIDPGIAFGRPIVRGHGITTEVLADRIDAGESIADVAADYALSTTEVEQAILYERAA